MLKRITFVVMMLAALACFTLPAAAEPFAPVLTPPENLGQSSSAQVGIAMLKSVEVPDRSAVNVPPYPGAKIIQTLGTRSMEVNGKQVKCLKYVKLLSTDDGAKIEAFYKKHLTDYKFENKFGGMIRVFWKGPQEINPMDIGQMCQIPNVLISDSADLYKDLMPDAKAVIEITYP